MDDVRIGAAFRAVRIRRGWRQADVAARARVSPSLVSLLERGHVETVSLRVLRRVSTALEVRLELIARWRGGELDRLLNAGHAALHEALAQHLHALPPWIHAPEVSFSVWGERGVIDILAFHPPTRSLLVIELKTELVSVEDVLTTMDRRRRLAAGIALQRGWDAASVSVWVVLAASEANRKRVAAHRATLRAAFPADGHAARSWLRRPHGELRALSLWSDSKRSGVTARRAGVKRVRKLADAMS